MLPKLEQAGQVGQTRELRVSLGKVIDKIRLINTMDNLIHKKSEEMRQLIEEVMGDIDDLAQRHHIFWFSRIYPGKRLRVYFE